MCGYALEVRGILHRSIFNSLLANCASPVSIVLCTSWYVIRSIINLSPSPQANGDQLQTGNCRQSLEFLVPTAVVSWRCHQLSWSPAHSSTTLTSQLKGITSLLIIMTSLPWELLKTLCHSFRYFSLFRPLQLFISALLTC